MNDHTINLPIDLKLENIMGFSIQLHELPDKEHFVFDVGETRWFPPFSMLFLAQQFIQFRKERPDTRCSIVNYEKHDYVAHMGFFKSFGVDYGKKPGEAEGNSNYLPITKLSVKELCEEASTNYENVGEVIERYSRRLASILTREDSGDLVDTLEYSLREIIRNVVEHSNAKYVSYCAQYWPTKKQVEIGIIDAGIGIHKALSNNPYITISSDRDALLMSLLPGISGKAYKGQRRNPNDVWGNSGYGLYMTSRLCSNGGSFFIGSGDAGIVLKKGKKSDYQPKIKGTAIRMVLSTSSLQSLNERLEDFRNEGYDIVKKIKGASNFGPSVASQMLSRDFKS